MIDNVEKQKKCSDSDKKQYSPLKYNGCSLIVNYFVCCVYCFVQARDIQHVQTQNVKKKKT